MSKDNIKTISHAAPASYLHSLMAVLDATGLFQKTEEGSPDSEEGHVIEYKEGDVLVLWAMIHSNHTHYLIRGNADYLDNKPDTPDGLVPVAEAPLSYSQVESLIKQFTAIVSGANKTSSIDHKEVGSKDADDHEITLTVILKQKVKPLFYAKKSWGADGYFAFAPSGAVSRHPDGLSLQR